MKKLIGLALMLCLLLGCAAAELRAKANTELRSGPGLSYSVAATVEAGAMMEDLDCVETDERGTDWYWLRCEGQECWGCAEDIEIVEGDGWALSALTPDMLVGSWTLGSYSVEGGEYDAAETDVRGALQFYVDDAFALALNYFYEYTYDTVERRALPTGYLEETPIRLSSGAPWYVQVALYDEMQSYISLIDQETLLVENYYLLDGAPTISAQTYWSDVAGERCGLATLQEERSERNILFIEIDEGAALSTEEAELIERYGLIKPSAESRVYMATKDGTRFALRSAEGGARASVTNWQGFVNRLLSDESGIYVRFRAEDQGGTSEVLLEIEEITLP